MVLDCPCWPLEGPLKKRESIPVPDWKPPRPGRLLMAEMSFPKIELRWMDPLSKVIGGSLLLRVSWLLRVIEGMRPEPIFPLR